MNGTNWQEYAKKSSTFGMGIDLGAVYEWRENYKDYKYDMDGKTNIWARNKNKYKLQRRKINLRRATRKKPPK